LDPFTVFKLIAVAAVGLALGSFAAAMAYRLPRGVRGVRSVCPSCGHTLGIRDLVPVFSWLCLKGRCRYCAAPISARYPLIELAVMLGVMALYFLIFEN
jgi:leader peptidase (prepilin peptidase)/N-methyltransferase